MNCPLGLTECTRTCSFCEENLCDYPYIGAEKVEEVSDNIC